MSQGNDAFAQRRLDSLNLDNIRIMPKSKIVTKLVQQGIDAIRKDPNDTTNQMPIINAKSEVPFKKYEGRVIRSVTVNRIGFEQKVTDTNNRIRTFGANVLNAVHIDTKEWVIKNNLFIKEGQKLNAFEVSDNERWLRSLNFIQDSRIVVHPVDSLGDSVDIEVITKDVFTISGGASAGSLRQGSFNVSDANFLGMGQRIEFQGLVDQDRVPIVGHRIIYGKTNIVGSFVNATIGYSTFNPSLQDGRREEHAYYVQLDRPLVSPYSMLAGGLYFGQKLSRNHYQRVETDFYRYNNLTLDAWAGVNIGGKRLLKDPNIRDRRFVSARYMNSNFDEVPAQVGTGYNAMYNNMRVVLGQLTFFRQDYFKTNYIYGFGITEDIPYGYNLALIGGWAQQMDLKRPYAGIKADKFTITNGGDFYSYFIRTGGFIHEGKFQDVSVLAGTSLFTRLLYYRNIKMRQYFTMSYSRLFNTLTNDWLRLNNPFGLRDFRYPWLGGYQRWSMQSETSVFLSKKFLGFNFAPFFILNGSLLTPEKAVFRQSGLYSGLGGGVRTRNENLIFGTMELRGMVFPRHIPNEPMYKITFTSNLRYRYNSNYITRPDFVYVNAE